jgi:hypothetical protein
VTVAWACPEEGDDSWWASWAGMMMRVGCDKNFQRKMERVANRVGAKKRGGNWAVEICFQNLFKVLFKSKRFKYFKPNLNWIQNRIT